MRDIELQLIRLLLNREFYLNHSDKINTKVFSTDVKNLVRIIVYLQAHKKDDKDLVPADVYYMYEANQTVTVAKLELIKQLLEKLEQLPPISSDIALDIFIKLAEKEFARQIADKALGILQRDEDAGSLVELQEFVNSANIEVQQIDEDLYTTYTTDITEIVENKKINGLFTFKNGLEFLNDYTGRLSRGHFVIVFAPTDGGKSSFIAQTLVGFLEDGYKVLYFANEDTPADIMLNPIRSVEQRSEKDILQNPITPKWEKIRKNFILKPCHGATLMQLEKIIDKEQPDIIIYDQLDNISVGGKQEKRHETLELLYQRTRAKGSMVNALTFVVSQASSDAFGKTVLRSEMMANSKVGKGSTADLIIGIGMKSFENPERSITICKNKITGIHDTIHCLLDYEKCHYEK